MAKTIIALYDDFETARDVIEELVDEGVPHRRISLVAQDPEGDYARKLETEAVVEEEDDNAEEAAMGAISGGALGLIIGASAALIPGLGPVLAAGPVAAGITGAIAGAVTGGILGPLVDIGVPEEEAEMYAEAIRRGGALVAVEAHDDEIEDVVELLEDHDPVNLERRAKRWRAEDWEGFDTEAEPYTREKVEAERERVAEWEEEEGPMTVEVVEEDVKVGKRTVKKGGVRVHTYVREEPVEEEVALREERVVVDRHDVDRPADEEDLETFTEKTMELTETAEEVVVGKEARVVEEVEVKKEATRRTEKVEATERRVEVDVEGAEVIEEDEDYDYERLYREEFSPAFREHCTVVAGKDYATAEPAYRFGYDLATESEEWDREWEEIEPQARRRWEKEKKDEGIWEEIKDSVRYAWNEVRTAFQEEEDYEEFEEDFEGHYEQTYARTGRDYEDYEEAYRFGYDLGIDDETWDYEWDEIESDVRRQWEAEDYDSAWEEVKDAVRYAWEDVRDAFIAEEEYQEFEPEFGKHYERTFARTGHDYDYYDPAYRYGYNLGLEEAEDRDWREVEPAARKEWEHEEEAEPWEDVKDAVRHAWQEVKDAFSGEDDEAYAEHEADFRRHYEGYYARTGRDYEEYESGYRYGYNLANEPRYRDRRWEEIEPEIRNHWATDYEGHDWANYRESIRYGWNRARAARQ